VGHRKATAVPDPVKALSPGLGLLMGGGHGMGAAKRGPTTFAGGRKGPGRSPSIGAMRGRRARGLPMIGHLLGGKMIFSGRRLWAASGKRNFP